MSFPSRSRVGFLLSLISFVALVGVLAMSVVLQHPSARAANGDVLVSVGSPSTPFPQNKQNEPAVAVDPNHPTMLAAGANDEIDLAPCVGSSCPFTQGVGISGIYFSFDSGHSWTQPTYTGWSARSGTPGVGPIGTLPFYFENGLVSDGDPGLAFGPRPDAQGHFSWANGSRLYYSNLVANFSTVRSEQTFKGFEAIGVSRTDNVQAAAAGSKSAWMPPVIVSRQSSATFSDKEQVWADDAASSPFFGHVYLCWASFRGIPGRSQPLVVASSTDGGTTWQQKQVTPAPNNAQSSGRSGCTIRTDSHGVVYVFYEEFGQFSLSQLPPHGAHFLVRSFDGGVTWTRPQMLFQITDPCFFFDPVEGRCVFDGIAGARSDLSASPSISIANGAPTGVGATNEIVDAWADGRNGQNHEQALVSWSTDGGSTWSGPINATSGSDRPEYVAPAISPTGTDLYLTYLAFTTAFQNNTSVPRLMLGVFLHASVGSGGAPGSFTTLNRGTPGDARGSSANSLAFEFIGDYVYAAATNTYGVGLWMDARNAPDCPKIDAYRASLYTSSPLPKPAPATDCSSTFGNTDIFASSSAA